MKVITVTIDEYDGKEVILQPNERVDATLTKDDNMPRHTDQSFMKQGISKAV